MRAQRVRASLNRFVRERANDRGEYCLAPDSLRLFPHEVDHVIAVKHGGEAHEENLALSCIHCNRRKGSDLATIGEDSELVALFNPRRDKWSEHFRLVGPWIVPLTPIGRATARLLQLNHDDRLLERAWSFAAGQYPESKPTT